MNALLYAASLLCAIWLAQIVVFAISYSRFRQTEQ